MVAKCCKTRKKLVYLVKKKRIIRVILKIIQFETKLIINNYYKFKKQQEKLAINNKNRLFIYFSTKI